MNVAFFSIHFFRYSGDFFDKKSVILPHFTTFYLNLSHFTKINLPHLTTFYRILPHFTPIYLILPYFTSFDLFQKKNPTIGIRTAQKIFKQLGCGLGTTLASTFNLIASKFYGLL
jgi:hypothetical protein